jgi:hypothetical protein
MCFEYGFFNLVKIDGDENAGSVSRLLPASMEVSLYVRKRSDRKQSDKQSDRKQSDKQGDKQSDRKQGKQ